MSAPSADFPALGASTSSSGYTDGLGRRALAFDREDGTMLERLVVRAELSAFERSLRERLERIAALDDERLARPRSIERSPDGSLIVLSEFVPGSRLSDLLDATAQQGAVPGVDVALGFLLDVFPALVGLHAGGGFAHGAITPGRTVLTPAGQVVLLDGIFGDALARLHYSRHRLWREFGIAMPPAAGPPRFDAAADIAQTVLSAVMLVLGRPISEDEYPDSITSLLVEVVDVAQIRGSSEFAAALQRFLQRCLPVPGRRPYSAADDALIDARDLARALGVEACRRAFLEFIEQQDTSGQGAPSRETDDESTDYAYAYGVEDAYTSGTNGDGEGEDDEDPGIEIDLELDEPGAAEEDTVYDLDAGGADEASVEETPAEEPPAPFAAESFAEALREPDRPSETFDTTSSADEPAATTDFADPLPVADEPAPVIADETSASFGEVPDEPAASFDTATDAAAAAADTDVEESAAVADVTPEPAYEDTAAESGSAAPELEEDSKNSRRRKRSRSARSRKDKLRSAARPQPLAPKPPPPPALPPPPPPPPPAPIAVAPPAKAGGWHVESSRPSFEPKQSPEPPPFASAPAAVPPPPAPFANTPPAVTPPPPPFATPPAPVTPVIVAPPPAPPPIALAPPPQRPIALAPPAPPPIALQQPAAVAPPPASAPKLKLKSETIAVAPRKPKPDPVEDLYAPRPAPRDQGTSQFPWKIASGALVVLVAGLVGWRALTAGGSDEPKRPPVETAAAAPPAAAAPAMAPRMGRVQIETQPPGARVLLDGKPAGESPTTLEVPAGRHTLTLATATGSVRRTIRVEAGKTLTVDVPIFSGWVDVNAPIILDVAEDGKSIGTTEQNRLLLRPGRHVLTFSNRDLDYTSTHTLDVEPGEVKTLNLDPRGSANLNAIPWAEVWIDGKKAGETPLANLQVPLGTHEIVFKHPQFGERRMTTTIRANAPIALSVDLTKPQ